MRAAGDLHIRLAPAPVPGGACPRALGRVLAPLDAGLVTGQSHDDRAMDAELVCVFETSDADEDGHDCH